MGGSDQSVMMVNQKPQKLVQTYHISSLFSVQTLPINVGGLLIDDNVDDSGKNIITKTLRIFKRDVQRFKLEMSVLLHLQVQASQRYSQIVQVYI